MSTAVQATPSTEATGRDDTSRKLQSNWWVCRIPRAFVIALISAILLVPCFWHSRIQAGDLSSHIYNVWLTTQIEANPVEGLSISAQSTNILFDLMLLYLLKSLGANAAQKIAVSVGVLILFWGAFAFVSAVSRRRAWYVMPLLSVVAYGWVFHMGFFNFYLSTGLCFWAVAICWKPRSLLMWAAAVSLFITAFTAHALPALWAAAVMGYVALLRLVSPRYRPVLTLSLIGLTIALRPVIGARVPALFDSSWSVERIIRVTGIDQVLLFGPQYVVILAGLLLVWTLWFQQLTDRQGFMRLVLGIPFQFWLLHALGLLLLPIAIFPSGYSAAFRFIPERMTLTVAITVCALLSTIDPTRPLKILSIVVVATFFVFVYLDTRRLNLVEDKVNAALSTLPHKQRVIGPLCYSHSRINALLHTVDRACIGKCFSFGNYEPSSLQFRLRATGPNALVIDRQDDLRDIESGTFTTTQDQLPMYLLSSALDNENIYVEALTIGEKDTSACKELQ